jgi:putative FmdB family regulatory protein
MTGPDVTAPLLQERLDMPIFEYKCQDCGHVTEVLQKSRKSTKQTCEKCDGSNMKRLLSGFAVGQGKSSAPTCDSCASLPSCGGCPGGTCSLS